MTEEQVRAAVTKGNRQYWEDNRKQEMAFIEWKNTRYPEGQGPTLTKGSIIDYITQAIMEAQ